MERRILVTLKSLDQIRSCIGTWTIKNRVALWHIHVVKKERMILVTMVRWVSVHEYQQ